MNRISIIFNEEAYKLQEQAAKKKISLSKYVRDLVDIGLRVEEAAANNEGKNNREITTIEALGELKTLWKNNLIWSLESRYLIRYLVENLLNSDNKLHLEALNKAKEKSEFFVKGLLHEEA